MANLSSYGYIVQDVDDRFVFLFQQEFTSEASEMYFSGQCSGILLIFSSVVKL